MRGKYRVIGELARGGMSVLYLAVAPHPGAIGDVLVVLKELRSELAADRAVVAMFAEEGRVAALLRHPNIVRTLEAGDDQDRHYIVMEYLEGQSLDHVLSRTRRIGRPLHLAFQGAVLCAVLEGLAHAHAACDRDGKPLGVVHRDVSPHNVFVGYRGDVKILDFGIAKTADSEVVTRTGIVKGKVAYMSPEQAGSGQVDARTDVFAVGVMLWEAVSGRRFWSGMTSDTQILRALWQGQLRAGHDSALAAVPEVLRAVIGRATALDPAQRYASAAAFLSDLRYALLACGAPPAAPHDVGRVMHELFAEERSRMETAIERALGRAGRMPAWASAPSSSRPSSSGPSQGPTSGQRRVAAQPEEETGPTSSARSAVSEREGSTSAPPPSCARAEAQAEGGAATREELLATAERLGLALARLQESERVAALPQSVQSIARAVHGLGSAEPAAALETLSDCMEVVEDVNRWRQDVVEHLRASALAAAPPPSVPAPPLPVPVAPIQSLPVQAAPVHATLPVATSPAVSSASIAWPPTLRSRLRRVLPRRAGVALGALGVLVTGATLGALLRPPPPPAPLHSTMPPSAALAPVAPPVGAPAADGAALLDRAGGDRVHVIVRASPPGARIAIDHQLACENPCLATLPKSSVIHVAHVEADGYQPEDHAFAATADITFILALEPRKPTARPVPAGRAPAAPPAAEVPAAVPTANAGAPGGKNMLAVQTCKSE